MEDGPGAENEALFELMLRACKPLYCHEINAPWPREIHSASCFFLRFGDALFGVTAYHVVDTLLGLHAGKPQVFQVSPAGIDLPNAIIDADVELEIATFRVSYAQLNAIGAVAIDCSAADWPPPKPEPLWKLGIIGFPEGLTTIKAPQWAEFVAYGALPAVEDVSERDIICTYDPKRDQPAGGLPAPPLGFNMSGCSGGLGLMFVVKKGLTRWYPVGLIYRGSRETPEHQKLEFDMIYLRRLNFIRSDGTIIRQNGR